MTVNAKKLNVLALIIFTIFIFVNIFWIITMYIPYSGYISKVNKEKTAIGTIYEKHIDEYNFKVSPTPYLGYDAFLSVGQDYNVILDDKGNIILSDTNITLFIWPNIWTGNEYGIMILNEMDNVCIQAMIDEKGNYLQDNSMNEKYNNDVKMYLEDNQDEISKLLSIAKDTWGLNVKNDITVGLRSCLNNKTTLIFSICSLLLTVFILGIFKWLLHLRIPFNKYIVAMNKTSQNKLIMYKKETEEYILYAKKPLLLKNNGYLKICYNLSKPNSNNSIELLIYPQKNNKAIVYYKNTKICESDSLINGNKEMKSILSIIYTEEVIKLTNAAKEFWSLDSYEKG